MPITKNIFIVFALIMIIATPIKSFASELDTNLYNASRSEQNLKIKLKSDIKKVVEVVYLEARIIKLINERVRGKDDFDTKEKALGDLKELALATKKDYTNLSVLVDGLRNSDRENHFYYKEKRQELNAVISSIIVKRGYIMGIVETLKKDHEKRKQ